MNNIDLLAMNIKMNPTRIELELTERCNLSCRFCYNSQKPLDSNKTEKIIDRLASCEVPEIILTGGEPTIHHDFIPILIKCSSTFAKVMVQTNGTLITDHIADVMAGNNIFEVNISIHGCSSIHDKLTCVDGSRELALNSLKKLLKRNLRVSCNFVITSENVFVLSETIEELNTIGVHRISLTCFTPIGVGANNKNLHIPYAELISVINDIDEKTRQHKNLNITLAHSMPYCSLSKNLKHYCEYCHFGSSRFYIDINGNVLMCGMSRVCIGNILEEDFISMKEKSDYYQRHILGTDVPDLCTECEDFSHCRGGCRAAALAHSGDFYGIHPYSKKYNKLEG